LPGVQVYFDPIAQGSFRTAVENGLQRILMALEMEMKARAFSQAAPPRADAIIRRITGAETDGPLFPRIDAGWGRERAIGVEVARASRGGEGKLPTSVQQNVPAWALFGMFFIVVPLGGTLIRERQGGTLARLLTLPVSYSVLLLGKVIAYVLICLVQFGIILLIGIHVMPLLGTPVLEIGSSPEAILVVVVSAALAACGYGILLGTVARTYEQASMFGAVSVVIAAAVGGIMVPVYVMPEMMRRISDFSPLAWGLNALTDIFAREGTLQTVQTEVFYLLAFALGTMSLAWGWFVYNGKIDN
jgi:ABC-2 type transport system permease protein